MMSSCSKHGGDYLTTGKKDQRQVIMTQPDHSTHVDKQQPGITSLLFLYDGVVVTTTL